MITPSTKPAANQYVPKISQPAAPSLTNFPPPLLQEVDRIAAKLAWKYFERNWNPQTGLVNSGDNLPWTTWWDQGSALLGIHAAQQLGLLPTDVFQQRMNTLLTDGSHSSSSIKGTRHQEAEAAGKIIGATYEFYAFEECNFSTQAVIKVTEDAIRRWQPDLIITHAPQPEKYGHRDHEVCAITVSNVATRKNIPLWYSAPPVFLRGFEPNFFVDITSVIEQKIAAIDCYESEQEKSFMQLDAILVLSRFWARELGQKEGYFEAFEISRQLVDASFFTALTNFKNKCL